MGNKSSKRKQGGKEKEKERKEKMTLAFERRFFTAAFSFAAENSENDFSDSDTS